MNSSWRLLARWNYDHANSRNLESFAGVEFSNCCTTIRVIAREWVRQYAGEFSALRGDYERARGNNEAAREAYQEALVKGVEDEELLRMKITDLGGRTAAS